LVANSIAEQNGAKLAAWITNWNNNGGRPVQLIGHSLGARVVCSALNTLRTWNYSNAVEKVVLLGAAIEDDEIETDDLYGLGVQQAAYNCSNFYKTDDQVLDKAYGIAELDSALGQWGIQNASQSPYNYQQLNVTNSVTDHNSYYEPYEGCIDEVASVVWGV
jgi:esterase/lipase superfamily enzyme